MFFVGKTEDIALKLAEPLAQELGVYIYDLEYKKDGADWRLTVYIDKDCGVNINDCNEFCSRYSDILDEADPITNSYCLSISSPGIERRLRTKQHYDWATGKKIEVKLFSNKYGAKNFTGIVDSTEETGIKLVVNDEILNFEYNEISAAKVCFDFNEKE